jgi:signal recognition particle receptor subunit beta
VLDFGRITLSETLLLYFFGHPSGFRIDRTLNFMMKYGLSVSEMGFVLMMDNLRSDLDRENKFYLDQVQTYQRPSVVVLSRQDLPEARTPEQMRAAISIPDHIKVMSYDRGKPATAKQVILELLKLFPQTETAQQAIQRLNVQR